MKDGIVSLPWHVERINGTSNRGVGRWKHIMKAPMMCGQMLTLRSHYGYLKYDKQSHVFKP